MCGTLDKVSRSDLTLQLDSGTLKGLNPVEVVRDLGVLLDCELSMKQHIADCKQLFLSPAPSTTN